MFKRIVNLTRQPMVQNTLALYGVTIANALLPLVLIPYLARVLKPDAWGMVLFAQTTSIWLGLLIEYGFWFSGTREVARHADQPEKLREIVAGVIGAKLLLCVASVAAAFVTWMVVPVFQDRPMLLVGALWIAVAQGLGPLWYFQGVERMRLPAALDVAFRVLYVISVFIWIKEPGDAPLVLVLQATSITAALCVTLGLMYREVGVSFCALRSAWEVLREGWHLFLFVALQTVYGKANSFLLGLVTAPAVVSIYGGPERLLHGIRGLTAPINQVLYPRLTYLVKHDYSAARKTARVGTLVMAAIGVCMGLSLTLGAPWFVSVMFGPGYEGAVPVLRVLGLVCPLSAVSSVLGVRWMFPLGMERTYNGIVVLGAVLDVVLLAALVHAHQAMSAAYAVLATEAFITITVFVLLWRRKLNPFQKASVPGLEVSS